MVGVVAVLVKLVERLVLAAVAVATVALMVSVALAAVAVAVLRVEVWHLYRFGD
jgi:hypothetical protein